MRMRAPIATGLAGVCALALGACGGGGGGGDPASAADAAVAPAALSSAPGSCPAVAARTLRAIAARIDARAAADRRRALVSQPTLVARLTGAPVHRCAASAGQTVADTVGAVAERLVGAEARGPEVVRALRLVSADQSFVRAVEVRDAAALRAAIVRFFEARQLHIVRVRAVTANGRLVGDVGGPYVLAPASRSIRVRGRVVGRVTLSIQDDAGFVKLMRRFTGAAVVLRAGGRVLPVSARPAGGGRVPRFAFATRAFPAGRLDVALLVPLAPK
jgi:hypothetical protein